MARRKNAFDKFGKLSTDTTRVGVKLTASQLIVGRAGHSVPQVAGPVQTGLSTTASFVPTATTIGSGRILLGSVRKLKSKGRK